MNDRCRVGGAVLWSAWVGLAGAGGADVVDSQSDEDPPLVVEELEEVGVTEAPLIVGTTEIYRNQLFDSLRGGSEVSADLVVLDEAHYLADEERGHDQFAVHGRGSFTVRTPRLPPEARTVAARPSPRSSRRMVISSPSIRT